MPDSKVWKDAVWAAKDQLERFGEVRMPYLVIGLGEERTSVLVFDGSLMSDKETKFRLSTLLRQKCAELGVKSCAFVSEVWGKFANTQNEFPDDLAEDHDFDGVMVLYQEVGHMTELWFADIKSVEGLPTLGDFVRPQGAPIGGIFFDLLGQREVH